MWQTWCVRPLLFAINQAPFQILTFLQAFWSWLSLTSICTQWEIYTIAISIIKVPLHVTLSVARVAVDGFAPSFNGTHCPATVLCFNFKYLKYFVHRIYIILLHFMCTLPLCVCARFHSVQLLSTEHLINKPPIQWVPGLSWGKATIAWHWPPIPIRCWGYRKCIAIHCTSPCGSLVWVQVTQRHNNNNLFNKSPLCSQISRDTQNSCSLLNKRTYFLLSLYFKIVNIYSSQRSVVW